MLRISNAIWDSIVKNDEWIWIPKQIQLADYRFLSDPAKLEAFRKWLQEQIDQGLLEVVGGIKGKPWTAKYVESAYRKGVLRSYTDTHKDLDLQDRPEFYLGSKEQFLKDVFAQPETMQKIQLLYMRAFESMRGMSGDMSAKLSRILADGMANGYGAVKIARAMRQEIDGMSKYRALLITRTEIIHAHAEGQLDSLKNLGIKEVILEVEWLTARDSVVCSRCASMEGKVFTIDEAHGKIPLHPNCRCCWQPRIT
jgi:SPP1 gp7 family putative phage head morphogenesis protein